MSDEEDIFESEEESGEDFSASEDEWKPGKGEISEDSMEESDNSEEDEEPDEGSDENKKRKPKGSKNTKKS